MSISTISFHPFKTSSRPPSWARNAGVAKQPRLERLPKEQKKEFKIAFDLLTAVYDDMRRQPYNEHYKEQVLEHVNIMKVWINNIEEWLSKHPHR
jgi:hypothetical protein